MHRKIRLSAIMRGASSSRARTTSSRCRRTTLTPLMAANRRATITDVKKRKRCWLRRKSTLTTSLPRRHVYRSWTGRSLSPSTTSPGTRSNSVNFPPRNATRCTRVRSVTRKPSTRKSSVGKTSIKSSSPNSSMSLSAFSSELLPYRIKLKLPRMRCLWRLIRTWSTG